MFLSFSLPFGVEGLLRFVTAANPGPFYFFFFFFYKYLLQDVMVVLRSPLHHRLLGSLITSTERFRMLFAIFVLLLKIHPSILVLHMCNITPHFMCNKYLFKNSGSYLI